MRVYKRIDRELFRNKPDQMVMRYNEMVDMLNSEQYAKELVSKDGSQTIFVGNQPDGSFGVKLWNNKGDTYEYAGSATFTP